MKQKRAFPRWPVRLLGQCYRLKLEMEDGLSAFDRSPCLITDLNETGLGFVSDETHEIGDILQMECPLDPIPGPPLQIISRVQYTKKRLTGVEFLNVRLRDRLRILDFVKANLAPLAKGHASGMD